MNEALRDTLVEAASFLESERLDYALIGGLAVSLRGQPRVTADVDMVVALDVERAVGLTRVLDQTAFRPFFDGVEEVVERAFILPLRHRTTNVRVDLAIGASGFERQTVARAERLEIAGGTHSRRHCGGLANYENHRGPPSGRTGYPRLDRGSGGAT